MSDEAPPSVNTRIELVEASGPVAPRHSFATTVVISCASPSGPARLVRDHRDAHGAHHEERELARASYDALLAELLAVMPLGAPLDLVATKRDRKGVSFNHVLVVVGDASARLDYLLSHVDEDDDGDPRARAIVALVKRAAMDGAGAPEPPSQT